MHGERLCVSNPKISAVLLRSSEFIHVCRKMVICHTNSSCQAESQGPWTSFSCSLTWEHMAENIQTKYMLQAYNRFTLNNLGIVLGRASAKVVTGITKF